MEHQFKSVILNDAHNRCEDILHVLKQYWTNRGSVCAVEYVILTDLVDTMGAVRGVLRSMDQHRTDCDAVRK